MSKGTKGLIALGGVFATCLVGVGIPESAQGSYWGIVVMALVALAFYVRLKHSRAIRARKGLFKVTRHIPQDVKVAVSVRDNGRCAHCGGNQGLQFDHVIPFSVGGSSTDPNNIQLLCSTCNQSKGNRFIG